MSTNPLKGLTKAKKKKLNDVNPLSKKKIKTVPFKFPKVKIKTF